MSIGLWRASLRRSTNSPVNFTYAFSGSQVKQVLARSGTFGLFAAIAIFLSSFFVETNAGTLKGWNEYAKPQHYFDWRYAQKVWFEMNTWEAEEKEWAKYAADFEPWLEIYKKDPRKALSDLDKYPDAKRKNIQRGYDIQLAYDQWFDQVYSPWYNGHEAGTQDRNWTFDEVLASYAKRPSCIPQAFLNDCGPVPDWRDADDKAKEQTMMQKAAEEAAQIAAKRKRK